MQTCLQVFILRKYITLSKLIEIPPQNTTAILYNPRGPMPQSILITYFFQSILIAYSLEELEAAKKNAAVMLPELTRKDGNSHAEKEESENSMLIDQEV